MQTAHRKTKRCGFQPMDFLICSNGVKPSLTNKRLETIYYDTVFLSFFIISISISIVVAFNLMKKVVMTGTGTGTGKCCPYRSHFRNTSF